MVRHFFITLTLVFLSLSSAFAVTTAAFESEIDVVNQQLKNGPAMDTLGHVQIEMLWTERPTSAPAFSYDFARNKVLITAHSSHIESSESLIYLLARLGSILEFPLDRSAKHMSAQSGGKMVRLLRLFKTDFAGDFLSFIEQASAPHDPVVQRREQIQNLALLRGFPEKLTHGRAAMEKILGEVFPGEVLNVPKLTENAQLALSQYEALLKTPGWKKLAMFYKGFGSTELQTMVQKNQREKVAQYIEEKLPLPLLTEKEIRFWREQIEAIRHPSAKEKVSVFRGGGRQLKGYLSSAVRQTAKGAGARNEFEINRLIYDGSILRTLDSHSMDTGAMFISTTVDPDTAREFAEESRTLSLIHIDVRRVIPAFFAGWNEGEFLVPLIVFPDEITAVAKSESAMDKLVSQYEDLVKKSETYIKKVITLHRVLQVTPGSAASCGRVFN